MQTSEGNTACLQTGLNGLDKRVFMRSPLLVLDKLSTDPKGPPSSPRFVLLLANLVGSSDVDAFTAHDYVYCIV